MLLNVFIGSAPGALPAARDDTVTPRMCGPGAPERPHGRNVKIILTDFDDDEARIISLKAKIKNTTQVDSSGKLGEPSGYPMPPRIAIASGKIKIGKQGQMRDSGGPEDPWG